MGDRVSRALLLVGLVAATAVLPVTALWNGGSAVAVSEAGLFGGARPGAWWRDLLALVPLALAVLLLHRRPGAWPSVVVVGVAAGAASEVLFHTNSTHPTLLLFLAHASVLSLFGALAGAQSLVREPSRPLDGGTGVAGLALGAPVLASTVVATLYLLNGSWPSAARDTVFVAVGVAGAIAVLVCSRGVAPVAPPPVVVTVAGVLAALAPSVFTGASVERTARLVGVSADVLYRHPTSTTAVVGLAATAVALVLAVLAGLRVLAAVSIAAAVAVGVGPALRLGTVTLIEGSATPVLVAAVLAVPAGLVLGTLQWRPLVAAFACFATAAGLVLAQTATGGDLDKLFGRAAPAGTALLVVAVLAATTTASAVAPLTLRRHAMPVALGVVLPWLVLGGGLAATGVRPAGGFAHYVNTTDLLLGAGLLVAGGAALLVLVAVEATLGSGRTPPPVPETVATAAPT